LCASGGFGGHRGPTAKDLIANCLTLDPRRRYDIVQFMSHPWFTVRRVAYAVVTPRRLQRAHKGCSCPATRRTRGTS